MESRLMASRFKKWKMGKRDFLLLTTFFNTAPKYTKAAVTAVVGEGLLLVSQLRNQRAWFGELQMGLRATAGILGFTSKSNGELVRWRKAATGWGIASWERCIWLSGRWITGTLVESV